MNDVLSEKISTPQHLLCLLFSYSPVQCSLPHRFVRNNMLIILAVSKRVSQFSQWLLLFLSYSFGFSSFLFFFHFPNETIIFWNITHNYGMLIKVLNGCNMHILSIIWRIKIRFGENEMQCVQSIVYRNMDRRVQHNYYVYIIYKQ